jgi:hypothetical protein
VHDANDQTIGDAMAPVHSKKTFTSETSKARPAGLFDSGVLTLCWTGDRNSDNLSVASLVNAFPDAGQARIDPPKTVLGDASAFAPALAFFNGSIYMAWVGNDAGRSINVARLRFEGGRGVVSDRVKLPHSSFAAPALAASSGGEHLYLAWTGRDAEHSINLLMSNDGRTFGKDLSRPDGLVNLKTGERSHHAPALAWNRTGLHLAWTGTNGRLNHVPATRLGQNFPLALQTAEKQTFQASSPHGPSLVVAAPEFGDDLVLGWRDSPGRIHLARLNLGDRALHATSELGDSSIDGPQLVNTASRGLYLAWTGTDGRGMINIARKG